MRIISVTIFEVYKDLVGISSVSVKCLASLCKRSRVQDLVEVWSFHYFLKWFGNYSRL